MALSKEGALGIGRSVAAFVLNSIAAFMAVRILGGGFAYLFLRAYFPSIPGAERELVVNVFLAALAALCVSQFWSTTTAKWIWMVPVPLLLGRMALVASGHHVGGMMDNHSYGVWKHFFSPAIPRGPIEISDFDFYIFTLPSVRAITYSLVAWVSARWTSSRRDPSLPATESTNSEPRLEPTVPVIWPDTKIRWLSATNVLVATSVTIFAAMVVSGVSPIFPRTGQAVLWGANAGHLTLGGQTWRLITYSFLHFDLFHLAGNMVCLWWLGRLAERILGPVALTSIYLLTAIAAGLLSAAWDPGRVSAGASGAVLGIAGTLIAVVWYGKLTLPANQRFWRRIIVFLLFNLILGLSAAVDNVAHLAGLAAGLLFGFGIARSLRSPSHFTKFATVLLFHGREAIERHAYDSALQPLQTYLGVRPNDADGHALLGCSLHALERYDDAAHEYQLALTLGCKDSVIEANLAGIKAKILPE